ncbi:hypothetical protein ACFW04_007406 [Cataglyphis niger]
MDIQRVKTTPVAINLATIILKLLQKKRKTSKTKLYNWVRPMLLQRKQKGHFHTLFQFIKNNDDEQFFKFTRMTVLQFERLFEFSTRASNKKKYLRASVVGTSIIYYFVLSCSWLQYANCCMELLRVKINCDQDYPTCKIIWDKLSPIYLLRPIMNDFKRYSRDFQELWNMPNCFGAIDGKYIVIQASYNTGTSFFNYKKIFNIVLMAVCDAKYIFTLVDVGAFGSQSDGGVFKESAFEIAFDNNKVEIPDDSCLPGIDIKFPYYMIADEAFPLKSYIMRSYFWNRWRIFRSTIIAHVDIAEWIGRAGLYLHNILRKSMDCIFITFSGNQWIVSS